VAIEGHDDNDALIGARLNDVEIMEALTYERVTLYLLDSELLDAQR